MLDYQSNDEIRQTEISEAEDLRSHLSEFDGSRTDNGTFLTLFVVEDLSREVIEILGSHFDIDPFFFRAHIDDYVSYNVSKLPQKG